MVAHQQRDFQPGESRTRSTGTDQASLPAYSARTCGASSSRSREVVSESGRGCLGEKRLRVFFSSALQNSEVKVKTLGHVRLLVTPWTVAYQAPPSMGFSRQEYWSGVPLPSLCCRVYP